MTCWRDVSKAHSHRSHKQYYPELGDPVDSLHPGTSLLSPTPPLSREKEKTGRHVPRIGKAEISWLRHKFDQLRPLDASLVGNIQVYWGADPRFQFAGRLVSSHMESVYRITPLVNGGGKQPRSGPVPGYAPEILYTSARRVIPKVLCISSRAVQVAPMPFEAPSSVAQTERGECIVQGMTISSARRCGWRRSSKQYLPYDDLLPNTRAGSSRPLPCVLLVTWEERYLPMNSSVAQDEVVVQLPSCQTCPVHWHRWILTSRCPVYQ